MMYNYTRKSMFREVIVLKKIALIINFDKENAVAVATKLISMLKNKAELYSDLIGASAFPALIFKDDKELFSTCPTVAVLGGDGTIISTAKRCAPYNNILVGVNIGNLGYLSTIESNNLEDAAKLLLENDIHSENRYMLCMKLYSKGKEKVTHHALNEIVITRSSSSRLTDFTAYSGEKTLCHYRADGMIVATPTGSTAYSLSAGGPILSPDADAMVITPICPHMLRARSIVLPPKIITVKAASDAEIAIDGQIFESFYEGDYITIEKSLYSVNLVQNKELSFYDILQKKL